ncbi:MAG: DUF433 domain-containing protein [Halalkalicoccus sp.]
MEPSSRRRPARPTGRSSPRLTLTRHRLPVRLRVLATGEDVLGGDPRLDGTRTGVVDVYRRYESGETTDAIATLELDEPLPAPYRRGALERVTCRTKTIPRFDSRTQKCW